MDFNKYAPQYRWMTDHPLWTRIMEHVAKQLPPAASTLKLLDLSCGFGAALRDLTALRPDILPLGIDLAWGMVALGQAKFSAGHYIHGDATRLPISTDSIDAILLQRTYYFVPQKAEFLAEALRVLRPGGRIVLLDPAEGRTQWGAWRALRHGPRAAVDMFALHLAGGFVGRYSPESLARDLQAAGFARILAEPVADGFITMARGEKPHAADHTTAERVQLGTDALADGDLLAGEAIRSAKGRYIHLLIQQKPDKPAWKLTPDDVITWGAAGVRNAAHDKIALAFTSLPNAVGFMQQAVMAGAIRDVNKVGKFKKDVAAAWAYPILLNPALETVQANYQPLGELISVDPATAEAPDE